MRLDHERILWSLDKRWPQNVAAIAAACNLQEDRVTQLLRELETEGKVLRVSAGKYLLR